MKSKLLFGSCLLIMLGCASYRDLHMVYRDAAFCLTDKYPDLSFNEARLLADEPHRYVVGVFYVEKGFVGRYMGLGPYKLVAMEKNSRKCEELELTPTSPYLIKGYK